MGGPGVNAEWSTQEGNQPDPWGGGAQEGNDGFGGPVMLEPPPAAQDLGLGCKS